MSIDCLKVSPWDIDGAAVVPLYFATRAYTSGTADTPADTVFENVLDGFEIRREAVRPGAVSGRSVAASAVFTLAVPAFWKTSGLLATIKGYAYDGRAWELRRLADASAAFSSATLLAKGQCSALRQTGPAALQLVGFDRAEILNAPVQSAQYAGTGTFEGSSDLEGKFKPLVYGDKENVPGVMVDAANLWVDFAPGYPIEDIVELRDNGVALTVDAANPPAAGKYYKDLTNGRARLGSIPAGAITANIQGIKVSGAWIVTAGDIAAELVETHGGISSGDIDTAAITALNTARDGTVGIYSGLERRTVAELLDELLAPLGFWGFNRADEFTVGRIIAPTATASTDGVIQGVLTEYHIAKDSLSVGELGVPPHQIDMEYRALATVQAADGLAGAVSAADRLKWSTPALSVADDDSSILVDHPRSEPLLLRAPVLLEAKASSLATAALSLLGAHRDDLTFDTADLPDDIEIGEEFWLSHSDYGIAGKAFRVLGYTISNRPFQRIRGLG